MCVCAKTFRSCPALCDPMACCLLFSTVVSHFILLFYFCCTTCGILVPRPVNKSTSPALEAWSLNHWTSREVPERESVSRSAVSDSLQPHGLQPARLLCPWDSPGQNPGVGCHFLLQGIFPTQGLNLHLLHCRQILYHLNYQGSPWS